MKFLIFTAVAGLALLNPNQPSVSDHADEHDHDAGHEQHSGHDHSEMAEAEVTGDSPLLPCP